MLKWLQILLYILTFHSRKLNINFSIISRSKFNGSNGEILIDDFSLLFLIHTIGGKAYEELEGVVDKLVEHGMTNKWGRMQIDKLRSSKRHIKGEYKVSK